MQVDVMYNGARDNNLSEKENDLTLLDLAFIFKWNKVCYCGSCELFSNSSSKTFCFTLAFLISTLIPLYEI